MRVPVVDLTWLGTAIIDFFLGVSRLGYFVFPSRLKPLERRLLEVTGEALPDPLRPTFAAQVGAINVVQHGGGCQKIMFFKVDWCRARPDQIPPMSITTEKVRLSTIHFRVPDQERVRHAVVSARGARLYEINFDT